VAICTNPRPATAERNSLLVGRRTSVTTSSTGQHWSARERVVYAAAQQLRAAGPTAASLRAIVRDARAPWGSLRHYFPHGKEQILSEALAWSGEYAARDVTAYLHSDEPTPGGLFVHLLDSWARELTRCDFELGCPVAAATLDPGGGAPGLVAATRSALDTWLTAIECGLIAMGVPEARSQARSMLSMLEGAIIVCRVQNSTAALSELRPFSQHFDAAR
jgi:AcrR family transcriptional regulator